MFYKIRHSWFQRYCINSGENDHWRSRLHQLYSCYLAHMNKHCCTGQLPSSIPHAKYWSDGSANQFKDWYNFNNLLHHEVDFNCKASWTSLPQLMVKDMWVAPEEQQLSIKCGVHSPGQDCGDWCRIICGKGHVGGTGGATIKHQVRGAFLQDNIVVTDAESFVVKGMWVAPEEQQLSIKCGVHFSRTRLWWLMQNHLCPLCTRINT